MPDPKIWPIAANAADPVSELYGYRTDVLQSYGDWEQRVQLLASPAGGIEFSVLADSDREAALLGAIVYGGQDDVLGVPLWFYGSRLTAAVAPGASLLPISDALSVPYVNGGYALVWVSPFSWELFSVLSTGGGGVTTSDTSTGSWPAGSIVYPVRLGRLESRVEGSRVSGRVADGRLRFSWELPAGVPASSSPTTYAGFDVLDTVAPDRSTAIEEATERALYLLDNGSGFRTVDAPGIARAAPVLSWKAFSRTEAAALRAFLDARRGRAVPFWLSSGNYDLPLAADASTGAGSLVVKEARYSSEVFPAGPPRRRIAIVANGVTLYRKVTTAVDNGNGTETLGLDSVLPAPGLSAATARVSSLRLYRLEDDLARLDWYSAQVCEARLLLRELAREVPA